MTSSGYKDRRSDLNEENELIRKRISSAVDGEINHN